MNNIQNIGILTFHNTINYGASLQTVALSRYISSRYGCRCEIINYENDVISVPFQIAKIKQSKELISFVRRFVTLPFLEKKYLGFKEFMKNNVVISEKVVKSSNIKLLDVKYDAVIVGSDQVFNLSLTNNDVTYFLEWLSPGTRRYSYAASFGDYSYEELPQKYKEHLEQFDKVTLRENNVFGLNATEVIDPTLLLDMEEWRSFEEKIPLPKQYMLLYLISPDKSYIYFAKRFAKYINLEIVYICYSALDFHVGLKNYKYVTPAQFLYMIDNADFILTNSFHGTVFSINFKKQFFSLAIDGNNRIWSILQKMGLEDRLIGLSKTPKIKKISYAITDMKLKELRSESYAQINNMFCK